MRPVRKARTESRPPRALPILSFGVAVVALGCVDEGPYGPGGGPEPETLPAGLTISDPVPGADHGVHGVAYVSASPGTFPGASSAALTNLDLEASVPVDLGDGGFDPVPVAASTGDELEVVVLHGDGNSASYRSTVPSRKRPRIVRTRPPRGAVEVSPHTSIVIVFSEPMEAGTVTPETVSLRSEAAVASALTLDDQGLRAELLPRQSLEPTIQYTLVVSGSDRIQDRSGDELRETTVTFTTRVAWAPDPTQKIAFASTEGIHVVNADGSGLTRLTDGRYDTDAAWSPDGSRIAFTRRGASDARSIYTVNADGSGLTRIAPPLHVPGRAPEAGALDPVWSPDGSQVAFWRDGDGTTWGIWTVDADGTESVRLSGQTIGLQPAWSADGTRIYYVSTLDLDGSWIATVHADGGDPSVFLRGPWPEYSFLTNPIPSPDGQKIAFQRSYAGQSKNLSEVYVVHADGMSVTRVNGAADAARDQECNPSWSPDGSMIAFWSARLGLAVTDRAGRKPRGLYPVGDPDLADQEGSAWCGSAPTWSPDGARIAFAMNDRLYVVDVASGARRQLLPNGPGGIFDPRWSPVVTDPAGTPRGPASPGS